MRNEWDHLPDWVKARTIRSDGCWEWSGPRHPKDGRARGYDPLTRRTGNVARFVVAAMVGNLPAREFVMHLCDNPPCVRPSHLRLGTAKENAQDALHKGRLRNGRGPVRPQDFPNGRETVRERYLRSTGQRDRAQALSTAREARTTRRKPPCPPEAQALERRRVLLENS